MIIIIAIAVVIIVAMIFFYLNKKLPMINVCDVGHVLVSVKVSFDFLCVVLCAYHVS